MEKPAGIDAFFELANPTEVAEEVMVKVKSRERDGHFISPISALSLQYLESGQSFLKGFTGLMFNRLGDIPKPEEIPNLVDPEAMLYLERNEYAIRFAATLHTIQQTLANGSCSLETYSDFYNQATAGTYLQDLSLAGTDLLVPWEWQQIIAIAKEDLSLSRFFTYEHGSFLPANLRGIMFKDNAFIFTVKSMFIRPHQRLHAALNLTNKP